MMKAWPIVVLILALGPSSAVAQRQGPARLGHIEFPASAGAEAHRLFEQGVLWMHSFEYDSAAVAFRAARQIEPDFAMAYWGEAMTYNHPVWNERDEAAARSVLARLGSTPQARASKAGTARERAWLGAAEQLWANGPKPERDRAYADAMAAVARNYPDDEADAFHALAILGLSQGVRDIPSYMRAGKIALDLFRRSPGHPGAAHYVIHAFDDPDHAVLGLDAAEAYSRIAPDAGHAQHMTTHIFLALGMWDRVSRQNVVAMQASRGNTDSLAWTPGHYTWWLAYSRLQQGRWADARQYLEAQARAMPADAPVARRGFTNFLRDDYLLTTRDWAAPFMDWPDAVDSRIAITHLVRGLAAADMADAAALKHSADAAGALLAESPDDTDLRLIDAQLRALVLLVDGRADAAIAALTDAVALEAALPIDFGPPAIARPAHEALAETLLATGHARQAVASFERALARTPGRSRTLAGLAVAAKAAGDGATEERAMNALRQNFHAADDGAMIHLLNSVSVGTG